MVPEISLYVAILSLSIALICLIIDSYNLQKRNIELTNSLIDCGSMMINLAHEVEHLRLRNAILERVSGGNHICLQ